MSEFSVDQGAAYDPTGAQVQLAALRPAQRPARSSGQRVTSSPVGRAARAGRARGALGRGQPRRDPGGRRSPTTAGAVAGGSGPRRRRATCGRSSAAPPTCCARPGTSPTGSGWWTARRAARGSSYIAHDRPAPVTVPGITGAATYAASWSPGTASRFVAVVRRAAGDALVVSRIRHDDPGAGRCGASRARRIAWERRGTAPDPRHRLAHADHDRGARTCSPGSSRRCGPSRSTDRPGPRQPLDDVAWPGAVAWRRRRSPSESALRRDRDVEPDRPRRAPSAGSSRSTRASPPWRLRRLSRRPAVRPQARRRAACATRRALVASTRARRPARRARRPAARRRAASAAAGPAGCCAAAAPTGCLRGRAGRVADARARRAGRRRGPPAEYAGAVRAMVLGHKEHRLLGLRGPLGAAAGRAVGAAAGGDAPARRRWCWCRCRRGPRASARAATTRRTPSRPARPRLLAAAGHDVRGRAGCCAPARAWSTRRVSTRPPGRPTWPARCAARPARCAGWRRRRPRAVGGGLRRRADDRRDRPRGAAGAGGRRAAACSRVAAVAATRRRLPPGRSPATAIFGAPRFRRCRRRD